MVLGSRDRAPETSRDRAPEGSRDRASEWSGGNTHDHTVCPCPHHFYYQRALSIFKALSVNRVWDQLQNVIVRGRTCTTGSRLRFITLNITAKQVISCSFSAALQLKHNNEFVLGHSK